MHQMHQFLLSVLLGFGMRKITTNIDDVKFLIFDRFCVKFLLEKSILNPLRLKIEVFTRHCLGKV